VCSSDLSSKIIPVARRPASTTRMPPTITLF
jgi:hypothetical protein